MAKVLCVLYDDPVGGYPRPYARDDIPKVERYPDGRTVPTPNAWETAHARVRCMQRGSGTPNFSFKGKREMW